ncbi:monooxygenase [Paenibacillus xanthanilyticus]|uniref:Monooxygenase n=1 Tax=Paenibacillus xanthanilyticus TaxID=1783531 RepID=A0ABV8K8U6_9BACL
MNYDVIVVGGGPVGMMVAGELALADVKVCVLEKLEATTPYSRALSIHPRTLEMMDLRGLKSELLQIGMPLPTGHFAGLATRLDFAVIDSSSNYSLFIAQSETEKVLEQRAWALGADIRRGIEVLSVTQSADCVEVTASGAGGQMTLTAAYVVGADGAGSIVRKQANIPFNGTDATMTAVQGDVVFTNPPATSVVSSFSEQGMIMIVPVSKGLHRVVFIDPETKTVPKDQPVTLEELRSGMIRMLGDDFGISEPYWMTRFGNATRQAERYREGRLFLAGDAAHIHFPAGGQGMNVGLHEAMNLGWKLAAEVKGWAPEGLLDSYHAERFPVNTALLQNTSVQTLLFGTDFSPATIHLRQMISELLQSPDANYRLASQIAAVDIQYDVREDVSSHRLNGRRLAEIRLRSENGDVFSSYELFREGNYVLMNLSSDASVEEIVRKQQRGRIKNVNAALAEPAKGWDDVHTALVRPDGYIAWAIAGNETDLYNRIEQGIEQISRT